MLQTLMESDNSVLNVDETRYNHAAEIIGFPGMNDIAELVLIQIFIAKSTVKIFNISVLRWLTYPA